jgi:hypothetical protein
VVRPQGTLRFSSRLLSRLLPLVSHAGAGGGRSGAISDRISANSRRGTATLAQLDTFDRFADLADAVAGELGVREAVLNGEVIASDETGRPQF